MERPAELEFRLEKGGGGVEDGQINVHFRNDE
jgi:hypothetical protein